MGSRWYLMGYLATPSMHVLTTAPPPFPTGT